MKFAALGLLVDDCTSPGPSTGWIVMLFREVNMLSGESVLVYDRDIV